MPITEDKAIETALPIIPETNPGLFLQVNVADLLESKDNPRQHFDAVELKELTESVKAHGVLVPLLVRHTKRIFPLRHTKRIFPHQYEIICGARRYRAAKAAGVKLIPAQVRNLSDETAMELQIIDNLHRADIHPLDEAISYQALTEKLHYTTAQIADRVGKSESYVLRRVKLVDLTDKAQNLFWKGAIGLSQALQVCRLDPRDQAQVIHDHWYEQSPDGLRHRIQQHYHLDLHAAAFPKDDPELVKEAGPCTTCPKRTGTNPSLFPDIQKEDTCTDPGCFQRKVQAFVDRRLADLYKQKGQEPALISTEYSHYNSETKPRKGTVFNSNYHRIRGKEDRCEHATAALVVHGEQAGSMAEICTTKECKKHGSRGSHQRSSSDLAAERKRKLETRIERTVRGKLVLAAGAKIHSSLSLGAMRLIVLIALDRLGHDTRKELCAVLGREPVVTKRTGFTEKDSEAPLKQGLAKMDLEELNRYLVEITLFEAGDGMEWGGWSQKKKPMVFWADLLHELKIDRAAIEKEVRAELTPKPKTTAKAGRATKKAKKR